MSFLQYKIGHLADYKIDVDQHEEFGKRVYRGFTLVELLVVIAILGVILALLLPAINQVRGAARRLQCGNHLRQIGLGFINYEGVYKKFPPSHTKEPDHNVLTWLLPYVEQGHVYAKFDMSQNWNKGQNSLARKANIPVYRCPEAPWGRNYVSDYAANVKIESGIYKPLIKNGNATQRKCWYNMLRPDQKPVKASQITDGLSHTFMFFEDGGRPFGYTDGVFTGSSGITGSSWADVQAFYYTHEVCGSQQLMNCTNYNETYSFHEGGCFFVRADGSVHFHAQEMSPEVFFGLFTYNAGDIIPNE